jgi:hypothetical protein
MAMFQSYVLTHKIKIRLSSMAISNQPPGENPLPLMLILLFLLNPLAQYKISRCKGVYISTGKEVVE